MALHFFQIINHNTIHNCHYMLQGYGDVEFLNLNLSSEIYLNNNRSSNINITSIIFDGGGGISDAVEDVLVMASSTVNTYQTDPSFATTLRDASVYPLPNAGGSTVDFSNLYPAVIECFAIIICGLV